MTKTYYIGTPLGEVEGLAMPWSIEGIFDTLDKALIASVDGEFVAELNLNEKLPKELIEITAYWWNVEGRILDHHSVEVVL